MSLCVLNGYRISLETAADVFLFIDRFKSAMRPAVRGLVAKHLALRVAAIRDEASLDRDICLDTKQNDASCYLGSKGSPLSLARAELEAAHRFVRTSRMRDVERDFSFSVSLHVADNGYILANVVSEQPELIAIWEAQPEVATFAVDTRSDKPGSISEEEWDLRTNLWSAWHGTLTFDFPGEILPSPEQGDVLSYVPSIEQRAHQLAKCDALDYYCRRMRRSMGEEFWQHRYMKVIMRHRDFSSTTTYARWMARRSQAIALQLAPIETPADLLAFPEGAKQNIVF